MGKATSNPRPEAEAEAKSKSSMTVVKDVCAKHVSMLIGFLQRMGINSDSVPDICKTKDFYSHLIHHIIKPDQVLRGRITCLLTVNLAISSNNRAISKHQGAVAAIAEKVLYACARTMVAKDKDIFLGELSISYLSSAPVNTKVIVDCSVVRSGRNLTVVAMEFKVKKTGKLAYTARSTFFNMPVAKL
ncbi:hypothetical protein SO802_016324 [Lithocarpus litseifolius]|uniref:Thioesterase domain-containing protein n=1 Tax=Lithocarpus litseifolius TaxID=425828 RepID=A0AAW2CYR6_9ROSI